MRLRNDQHPEVAIEVQPLGTEHSVGAPAFGTIEMRDVHLAGDLVYGSDYGRTEEFRVLRDARAPTELRWKITVPAGYATVLRDRHVEVRDASGRVRVQTEEIEARDASDRVLPVALSFERDTLTARVDVIGAEYPIVVDPTWIDEGAPLVTAHSQYGALVGLADGRFLLIGGATASCEVFDPKTKAWTSVGALNHPRDSMAAVLLSDHRVLVIGGDSTSGGVTAETFDPTSASWTLTAGTLSGTGVGVGGGAHPSPQMAVQLPSGKVLLAVAGQTVGVLFDPSTGTFSKVSPAKPTSYAALQSNGTVLLYGYGTGSTYVFDPSASTYTSVTNALSLSASQTAMYAMTGKVMVSDGSYYAFFDTASSTFGAQKTLLPSYSTGNSVTLAPLPSGKLLLGAGALYDPSADVFSAVSFPGGAGNATWVAHAGTQILAVNGSAPSKTYLLGAATNGTSCATNAECESNNCVDGVCCDTTCTGTCQACDVATKVGTCSLVTGSPHGTRSCAGAATGPCAGTCSGSSAACQFAGATTPCSTASCTAGSQTFAGNCNGGGTCGASAPKACSPYACGTTVCNTTCASDSDCDTKAYCNKSAGTCVIGPKPDGDACTLDADCQNGHCVGSPGICCHTACDTQCNSCGTGTCTPSKDGTSCGTTTCSGSSLITKQCASGACASQPATACANGLVCADATSCKASCTTGSDCASGDCNAATGTCGSDAGVSEAGPDALTPVEAGDAGDFVSPPKVGATVTIAHCAKDSECPSGHCADGVCCDTACADKCHSCVLPSAIGKCTVEPAGVDLRNECGGVGACLATCDGKGSCGGATTGTICSANRCTSSTKGVGAAVCSGPGAPCNEGAVVEFDCSPYACDPAARACLQACVTSDECANGYTCDTSSKQCVLAANGSRSGCSTGGGAAPRGSLTVWLLVLGLIARGRFTARARTQSRG